MKRTIGRLAFIFAASGCANTAVITDPGPGADRIASYALPVTLFEVEILARYKAEVIEAPAPAVRDALSGEISGGGIGDDPTPDASSPVIRVDPDAVNSGDTELTIKSFKRLVVPGPVVDLHYDPSAFSHDNLTITLDQNMLLKQVKVVAEDQTGALIIKLGELAKAGAKLLAQYPASTLVVSRTPGYIERTFTVIVDPLKIDVQTFLDGKVEIEVEKGAAVATSLPAETVSASADCAYRVCYPTLTTRRLVFTGPGGVREERLVVVPDPNRLAALDVTRASFVKKTFTADFTDGVLTKVELDKPSEALAAIQAPLDVATSLITLPRELIAEDKDTAEARTNLANARVKEIEAQMKLAESYQKLRKTEAELDESSAETNNAPIDN